MAPYARPVPCALPRSTSSPVRSPFLALWAAMYAALDVSYWLVLLISIPTAGFLLRTFILFHDCTHGSFFALAAGQPLGRADLRAADVPVLRQLAPPPRRSITAPPATSTAAAPATSRPGPSTSTTRSPGRRASATACSATRLVMFGIGPIWSLLIGPRVWAGSKPGKLRNSILLTNVAVVAMVGRRLPRLRLAGGPADRGPAHRHRRHRRRLALLRPAPVRGRLLGEQRAAGTTRRPRSRAAAT